MEDCREILDKVSKFLSNELKLTLSEEKTRITNVRNEVATFLSVNIRRFSHRTYRRVRGRLTRITDSLRLTVPMEKVTSKLKNSGFLKANEPAPRFL